MKKSFWKSNETEKKVFEIINKIQSFFGNKVDNFKVIGKIYSKPDSFEVEFVFGLKSHLGFLRHINILYFIFAMNVDLVFVLRVESIT